MRIADLAFVLLQHLVPHHVLSRLAGWPARCAHPGFKNALIRRFIAHFGVDMSEAQEPDPTRYTTFNDFFARALRPDARPLAEGDDVVLCPADGVLSQFGPIRDGRIIQAKGRDFTVVELLGGDEALAREFTNGQFATVYLSPRDYHRLHMPLAGIVRETLHIPGRLFSVNRATTGLVPGLFARNERVVVVFDTESGPLALVLVGAMIVASIATVWDGLITPPTAGGVRRWRHPAAHVAQHGAEMGRFLLGSTVVALFAPGAITLDDTLTPGQPVKMGERLGQTAASSSG